MVNLEELSDAELAQLQKQFQRISEHYNQVTGEPGEVADIEAVIEEKVEEKMDEKGKSNGQPTRSR